MRGTSRIGVVSAVLLTVAPFASHGGAADNSPKAAPQRHDTAAEGRKYNTLLRRIKVEADRAQYGDFHDWGHWTGSNWAGHRNLPHGYWVYVAPDWCIFEKATGVPPGHNPKHVGRRKYGRLLRRLELPGDAEFYGDYHDYGYSTATSYRGHANLPKGYWVYAAPYWYIFAEAAPKPRPLEDPPKVALAKFSPP